VLVGHERRGGGPAGEADGKVAAQPKERVVPSVTGVDQREMRQIAVLGSEQGAHHRDVDSNLGWRLRTDAHRKPV
jgi:hypothetical protein